MVMAESMLSCYVAMHVFTYTVCSYTHSCTGLCANITSPTNGTVVVATYAVGSNATYRCNRGFELSGLRNRTCFANGTWSGLEPICNCMFKQDCIYILIHCVIHIQIRLHAPILFHLVMDQLNYL